jgi:hypothetical protein
MLSSYPISRPSQWSPYVVRAPHGNTLWPSDRVWRLILRGVAVKARFDGRHTILCELAGIIARRENVALDVAHDMLNSCLGAHVEELAHEFGLERHHAADLGYRVYMWLGGFSHDQCLVREQAAWPTGEEWLAIDRAGASRVGFDSRATLSSHFAAIVARRDRVSHSAAKRWVHGRIAVHAAEFARELGYGAVVAGVAKIRLANWLNSFDR